MLHFNWNSYKLGNNYIKFDSKFISIIYDEWIGKLLDESNVLEINKIKKKYNIDFDLKKIGIKQFKKNWN